MFQLEKLINGCYGTKTTKCYYLTLYAIYAMFNKKDNWLLW